MQLNGAVKLQFRFFCTRRARVMRGRHLSQLLKKI